jgi:hypothetical protein
MHKNGKKWIIRSAFIMVGTIGLSLQSEIIEAKDVTKETCMRNAAWNYDRCLEKRGTSPKAVAGCKEIERRDESACNGQVEGGVDVKK